MTSPDLSPVSLFGSLPLSRYRFEIRLSKAVAHLPYMGSAWRGLIGWELQRLICPFSKRPECKGCIIRDHCPYFQLFEDQSPISGIQEMPRGYIFSPSEGKDATSQQLDVTLIGDCIRYFPAVLKAIQSGKASGIGPSRIPYVIHSIHRLLPEGRLQEVPMDPEDWTGMNKEIPLADWLVPAPRITGPTAFALETPVRLRKQGKYMGRMEWPYFFATIVRRLEALSCLFSGGRPLGKERYTSLMDAFSIAAPIHGNLSWMDYSRYSSRQHKKVPMGGLIGTATLGAPDVWTTSWLQAAGLVHVGKGASMGLGKVIVGDGIQ
jgi:hypothetical protein